MIAVVTSRHGEVCAGGAEAVAEAGGRAIVVGDGAAHAAAALAGVATGPVRIWDQRSFAPGRWAAVLAPVVAGDDIVIVPNAPDGRDLAPRLAAELARPLLAGAVQVTALAVTCARWGGFVLEEHPVDGPVVTTLQPGVRGVEHPHLRAEVEVEALEPDDPGEGAGVADVEVLEVLPPDVATMDLTESPRIIAGGAGMGGAAEFALLNRVASALHASMGATRVVTDAGHVSHQRQIGTTGVVVSPRLYIALGISGAVQHVTGLGDPEHIVSVNVDPHCPMMAMADLAVVTDAPAMLTALAGLLGLPTTGPPTAPDPDPPRAPADA